MLILTLVLCGLAAVLNFVGAFGARAQATTDGFGHVSVVVPQLIYAAAGLLFAGAGVLRGIDLPPWARGAVVAAALLAVVAPLVYGRLTGQFTLSHHAVRFFVVAGVCVVLWLS